MRAYRRRLLALGVTGTMAFSPGLAGECTMEGGKLDLNVLFVYNETDLNGWLPVFNEASQLLFNATEGNLQLGKVNFYTACQPAKDKADLWISQGTGGASAHPNGCGTSGQHAFFSNIHKSNNATAHGQLGIVHELGHYVFGLADEYGGGVTEIASGMSIPPPGTSYMWPNSLVDTMGGGKAFFCTQESGGTGCIMDAGTTVTSAFSRSEFCSPGDHVGPRTLDVLLPGESMASSRVLSNNQEFTNHSDCWTQVASKLGITMVPDPPDPAAPQGHDAVVFNDIGGASRFVLTIDRSGSMVGTNLALAKTGARLFVDNSRLPRMEFGQQVPGDEVGVVSFSDSATVNSALSELMTEADKTAKKNAINALNASGGTSIGGGLRTALNQLLAQGTEGCIEAIILLSDGMHNSGESPASVTPDIVNRKAVVFSIGLGSGADTSALTNVASATGGEFYFASSAASLPTIFADIQATVTGAAILDRVKHVLSEAASVTFPVFVDSSEGTALFTFNGAGFSVNLTSPSGEMSDALIQAPGVVYVSDGPVQTFRVENAELGTWTIEVVRTGPGTGTIEMVASVPSLGTHLRGDAPESVNFSANPSPRIRVQGTVSEGPGVVGASVVAEVTRPDGSIVSLTLLDNGSATSGDEFRNDGSYSAHFTGFSGDGSYTFVIRANTSGAELVAGEDGPNAGINPPATPATRATTVTTNVSGLPDNLAPSAVCQNLVLNADASCQADALPGDVDGGSRDPEGGSVSLALDPPGPYALGPTLVMLSVTDDQGFSSSCMATIAVQDVTPPSVTCTVVSLDGADEQHDDDLDDVVRLDFTTSDNCALGTTSAALQLANAFGDSDEDEDETGDVTACESIPVGDGTLVVLECSQEHCNASIDDEADEVMLSIAASNITLVVSATDIVGNLGICQAQLCEGGQGGGASGVELEESGPAEPGLHNLSAAPAIDPMPPQAGSIGDEDSPSQQTPERKATRRPRHKGL